MPVPGAAVSLRLVEDGATLLVTADRSLDACHDSAPQQLPCAARVRLRHFDHRRQAALVARTLLPEVVAHERALAHDLSGPGLPHALGRAAVGFHLRHGFPPGPTRAPC